MSTILVPVDFSDISPQVVETAASLADARGDAITLLHVALPDPAFVGFEAGPVVVQEAVQRDFQVDHGKLEAIRADLAARGLAAGYLHFEGSTAEVILREAKRIHAGLIVMGSHGHGALYHLLVGSVTDAVLRKTSCPVLVVPYTMLPKD
ncbi:MAG TPA: universal stress protein [Candidatus Saccharimonadia bacterium]|nr:universal stress protein [Candidatus Saccharimonadia bacterium]